MVKAVDSEGISPCPNECGPPVIRWPRAVYGVGCTLLLYLAMAALIIVIVHLNLIRPLAGAWLLRTHVLCAGFGMAGASIASIRKYYRTLITESSGTPSERAALAPNRWTFGWVFYYCTRPILGAALGAFSFMLSFVGFQILARPYEMGISDEGKYLLYAVAFMSGFAASHVLDRLAAIARQAFQGKANPAEREE